MQYNTCYNVYNYRAKNVQINYEWHFSSLPHWHNNSHFESQLMVASPSGTSISGKRYGKFWMSKYWATFIIISVQGFLIWDYHFHLCLAYSLSELHTSHRQLWSHIFYQALLTATKSTSSCCIWLHQGWTQHMTWEYLTWCGYLYEWLPWVDIGHLLQPCKLLMDDLTPHCAIEFCCGLLQLSGMTSPVSPYTEMIDSIQMTLLQAIAGNILNIVALHFG